MGRSDIKILRYLAGAIAACTTGIAMAQSDPGPDDLVLDEIIVTATKRPVGLQDVPISLSVVTGDKIEAMRMAGNGRAAREATSVAMALAASWKPFVKAKASAIAMAAIRTASTVSVRSGRERYRWPAVIGPSCRNDAPWLLAAGLAYGASLLHHE